MIVSSQMRRLYINDTDKKNEVISNMGSNKQRSIVIALFFALIFSAAAFAAKPAAKPAAQKDPSPKELWAKVANKWDADVQTYHCKLFTWNYRTEYFIKNYPEFFKDDDKPPKVKWDYRVFDLRFKKPGKSLIGYDLSLNENLNEGSVVDRGVAYMLTYAKGTTLNFGEKDSKEVYIVFPYLNNKQFEALPIEMMWKAAIKILMIASRKEVYHKPIEKMRDLRGNTVEDLAIGKTMKRYDRYFKDGNVTIKKVPLYTKEDYDLNKSTGWLSLKKNIKKPATVYQLTMVPKNVKANRGITKVETFIDPSNLMFVGLQEYENGKLVNVMMFSDLTVNPDLPDNLWTDFFKGRTLSDKN